MNQLSYSNNLTRLVSSSTSNPFLFWPKVTREKATLYLIKAILEGDKHGRSFFFEKGGRIFLYFQVQYLDWDTKHFGYKCGVIKNFYIDEEINFDEIDEIREQISLKFQKYLNVEKFRFLSADIASQSKNGNYFIQSLGFRFILNWIDGIWIPKEFEQENSDISISKILPEEVNLFSKIAASSYYKEGRFYSDKNFDLLKVDALYEELVKNSYLYDDIVLSYRIGNNPIGLFVCKQIKSYEDFNNLKVAHLRFLLVDPAYRGKSYGYRIFRATLAYLKIKSDLITTGLESQNLISMNLHAKLGFRFNYSHNAYHLWNSFMDENGDKKILVKKENV
jgi:RimJ/RimL family protein N-acetyltransferase